MDRRGRVRVSYLALLLVFGVVLLIALNRKNVSAGLNVPIRYDDFHFTVLSARAIDPGGLRPGPGLVPYVVTLRVANRARRVDFRFRDESAVLIDARGREYHVSPRAQKAYEASRGLSDPTAAPLPAGTTATKDLVFEVPAGLRNPRLKIMGGGHVGDVLETVFFGRKQFVLP